MSGRVCGFRVYIPPFLFVAIFCLLRFFSVAGYISYSRSSHLPVSIALNSLKYQVSLMLVSIISSPFLSL